MLRARIVIALCLALSAAGCAARISPPPATVAPTPSSTPSNTPSAALTATAAPTSTPTPTHTPVPSLTPSATPSPTCTPTPPPVPVLLRSYPIDGDLAVRANAPLVLVFDQPMDPASIAASALISPTLAGEWRWPQPDRAEFSPANGWTAARYEVQLSEARSALGAALSEPLTLHFGVGGRGVPLPVLMYHRFRELDADASAGQRLYSVSPAAFEQQMDWLVQQGWHSIAPAEYAGYLRGEPLPPRPMVISIDDGYKEVYQVAHPVFQRTGLRPVLFVIISYAQNSGYLSWDQLRELVAEGYAVGAHSYDHTNLRDLEAAELLRQIAEPKAILERELGIPIDAYSYPYGSYSDAIIAVLREQGYATACTINPTIYQQPERPYHISRLNVPYDMTLEQFAALFPD